MAGTTHDPLGGGRPRLIFALGGEALAEPGETIRQGEFDLKAEVTRVGSGSDAHLRLSGLDDHQADIIRDEFDEYVFLQHSQTVATRINGAVMGRHPLRTGDRIEIKSWTLTYFREEYADHGRPFGGRQGGEGTIQPTQPPRSEVTPAAEPGPDDLRTVVAEQ